MASCARREIVRLGAAGIYHCWQRCVRRAYLLGKDPLTGNDHTHRREWFIQRLQLLVSCFVRKRPSTLPLGSGTRREIAPAPNGLSEADDSWLAPLTLHDDHLGDVPCASGKRASDKGLMSMKLDQYLKLLDWAGRELRASKRGAIPANLAPILKRLGIEGEELLDTLEDFPRLLRRLVGTVKQILERAQKGGGCMEWDLPHEFSTHELYCNLVIGISPQAARDSP